MKYTENYRLTKDERTEKYNVERVNTNWDKIDEQLKMNEDNISKKIPSSDATTTGEASKLLKFSAAANTILHFLRIIKSSTTAFNVQDDTNTDVFNVDTTNQVITGNAVSTSGEASKLLKLSTIANTILHILKIKKSSTTAFDVSNDSGTSTITVDTTNDNVAVTNQTISGKLKTLLSLATNAYKYSNLSVGSTTAGATFMILLTPVGTTALNKIKGRLHLNAGSNGVTNSNYFVDLDIQSANGTNIITKVKKNFSGITLGTVKYNSVSYYCLYYSEPDISLALKVTFEGIWLTTDSNITVPTVLPSYTATPTEVYTTDTIFEKIYSTVSTVLNSISFQNSSATELLNIGISYVTSITQSVTDSTTKLATTAFVKLASLGWGQTWQTPSRSVDTTYTNTTGKPIQVAIECYTNSGSNCLVIVNGLTFAYPTSRMVVSFIVPNGGNYIVQGSVTVYRWLELR